MRIVAIKILRLFWDKHPDAKPHLEAWVDDVRKAIWRQPSDTKAHFCNASILKNRRVVFNIKGNRYRLIVAVAYQYGALTSNFSVHTRNTMPSTPKPSRWRYDMSIHPIHTDDDYRSAMKEVSTYFDNEPKPGTEEGDRFEILLTLVEDYENRHFPVDLPDPVEAIKFRMEQTGLTPKDLQPMIGRLNRVYEILNRKRPLTLGMIRKLHEGLGIPAESLIKPSTGVRSG